MPRWIDMRYELDTLTYGDHRTIPQGFWTVIRFMRIGEYSQYWNAETNEAIGGPKWIYDDYVVRCINSPGNTSRMVAGIPVTILQGQGQDDINSKIFAVLPMTIPSSSVHIPRLPVEEDILYEIDKYAAVDIPDRPYRVTSRYKIVQSYPVHGDYGRVEVIYLSTIRIHGAE